MYDENEKAIESGNVHISEEVIAIVAGVAAADVKGVAGMCTTLTGGIAEFFGKKSHAKGVKIEMTEEHVTIGISITVEYGCKIPDVAWEVQERVKREVENMTGLDVVAVDVYVNGIAIPKQEEPADTDADGQE